MRIEFLALYGGPDQIMTVTSSLAAILGLVLMFWSKLVAAFFKVLRPSHRSPKSVAAEPDMKKPQEPPEHTLAE